MSRPCQEEPSPILLDQVQAYLECLRQGIVPDPLLADAWDRFFQICEPLVIETLKGCCSDKQELLDLGQDAMAEIVITIREKKHGDGIQHPRTWLTALIHHIAANSFQARNKHQTENLDEAHAAMLVGRDGDPAVDYEAVDQDRSEMEHLELALSELRALVGTRQYHAFVMRRLEDRQPTEVALLLNMTAGNVRITDLRVMRKLRGLVKRLDQRED